jgi:hypothetical protein
MLVFTCPHCHCPSFTLPAELGDNSEVACARCRASLGSWGHFRGRLERLLATGIGRGDGASRPRPAQDRSARG